MKDCNINFNNDCLPNLHLRTLLQSDISVVKGLCRDWFPIDYPDSWYLELTSNPRFYPLAAILDDKLVGLLVAETKSQIDCNQEDRNLLSRRFDKSTKVVYILTLGVKSEHRRKGIATYLLSYLINQLTFKCPLKEVKAIYLHTLSTNSKAINFYEKKFNFTRHLYLPLYYYIDYEERDGLSYVLYVNGGHGPVFLIDHLRLHPLINFLNINLRGIIFSLKKVVHRTIIQMIRNVNQSSNQGSELLFC